MYVEEGGVAWSAEGGECRSAAYDCDAEDAGVYAGGCDAEGGVAGFSVVDMATGAGFAGEVGGAGELESEGELCGS